VGSLYRYAMELLTVSSPLPDPPKRQGSIRPEPRTRVVLRRGTSNPNTHRCAPDDPSPQPSRRPSDVRALNSFRFGPFGRSPTRLVGYQLAVPPGNLLPPGCRLPSPMPLDSACFRLFPLLSTAVCPQNSSEHRCAGRLSSAGGRLRCFLPCVSVVKASNSR
jgi:hypothetical protein